MSFFVRRSVALFLSALLTAAAVGCGGKDRVLEPGLTPEEANDLMHGLAAMAASDSGGWYLLIGDAFQRVRGTPLSPGGIAGGPIVRNAMTWNLTYSYFDSAGNPQGSIDSNTRLVKVFTQGSGKIPLTPHQGNTGRGDYVHQDTLFVENLGTSDTTYSFSALSDFDTALVTIQSTSSTRYYHYDNLVDYTVEIRKSATQPIPLLGEIEIDAFVDVLRSPTPGDRVKTLDAKIIVTLDGTFTPPATITAVTTSPTTVYNYRIDLRTGQVVP